MIIPFGCGMQLTIILERVLLRVLEGSRIEFFLQLEALLEPFGISRFYGWLGGIYRNPKKHEVGKQICRR